jgi:hypothetical protein
LKKVRDDGFSPACGCEKLEISFEKFLATKKKKKMLKNFWDKEP